MPCLFHRIMLLAIPRKFLFCSCLSVRGLWRCKLLHRLLSQDAKQLDWTWLEGCCRQLHHIKSATEPFLTMPSLSGIRWIVLGLLLWRKQAAASVAVSLVAPTARAKETRCSLARVGARHPVEALLERFEAGPGCAARERGDKETHVIAVGRGTNGPDNTVTVLLKPLSLTQTDLRTVHLLLSSKRPISWQLEIEKLPLDLSVLVTVSSNSSVQSHTLQLHVQPLHWLPFRPRALYRWALKHHGHMSSLTHVTHGNRVYVRLGEDVTQPPVCQLQSMFLSKNYMNSDLQPQEIQGCGNSTAGGINQEVHVLKLHSAGSGLCGSLQVEVIVSLVPPSNKSLRQKVVLILSSSVPVNWAIVAHGVHGHIDIHSSNSVSPPHPPEDHLTLSTTLVPHLSSITDLLVWANASGYDNVTSYTEADQANRFVVQLSGTGPVVRAVAKRPKWAEERRLREWLHGGPGSGGSPESLTVQCEDGRLSVTLDRHALQSLSVPVSAVTLRDPRCQAQYNGSHFLLVFPVISCGTEGQFLGRTKGVQYKNMVLLWRELPHNDTDPRSSFGIHFSCLADLPASPSETPDGDINASQAPLGLVPDPGPIPFQKRILKSGPLLLLQLFVTESYKQRRIGPCVIAADQRVYVQISAMGSFIQVAEVTSCVVSPLSDPKSSPFWDVIRHGCPVEPSLTLVNPSEEEDETKDEEDEEMEDEKEVKDKDASPRSKTGGREGSLREKTSSTPIRPLRFSFLLRPVYNVSMQFLHCSLRLCVSDTTSEEPSKKTAKKECEDGEGIPPLISRTSAHQCETRNLTRPMVVTQPMSSRAHKAVKAATGQRTKRLSPLTSPEPPQQPSVLVHTGPVMGIAFAAFAMGVSLMGGLWCIYSSTGTRQIWLEGEGYLTDQTTGGITSPTSPSHQLTSSV
ncbi:transforming growth factor beta receptor type 3 [Entelurus aequoreus]|uniref:transforming growth factor beta receptor type 3 n=1 Tax=Entelurus aequoreus TaxID=161455 RepID=UPI002B1E7959|nr:transforming growth factor beta receptor type 3 [Entelurus aequoreus]